MKKIYEIRDPIHGFVSINEWEREIINHPVFQRMRRIKQLGFTEMVYPGGVHSRFEHSLGVMHVATKMFDHLARRNEDFLKSELNYTKEGLERDRILIRLAALLHDVGHSPFSHVGEELMPTNPDTGKPYKHEDYTAAIIVHLLSDVIENHQLNQNYKIQAREIADFLSGFPTAGRTLLWRELISGQIDADRADYLLRDSHHIGVSYGRYDLHRLIVTLTIGIDRETDSPLIAVEEGGIHAVEALILARYMMFTQVYFHHTRRAYDHHLGAAIKVLLFEEQKNCGSDYTGFFLPPTTKENLEDFLKWDDWVVMGEIKEGRGGEHGRILQERYHHRLVFETSEIPSQDDLDRFEKVKATLENKMGIPFIWGLSDSNRLLSMTDYCFVDEAKNSWYKFERDDVKIWNEKRDKLIPLSYLSSVVRGLRAIERKRIYVPYNRREEAIKIVNSTNF